MKSPLVFLAACTFAGAPAVASPALYSAGFETAEGYTAGALPSARGWAMSGEVVVAAAVGAPGQQYLRLAPGEPAAFVAREIALPVGLPELFVDFRVRPAAEVEPKRSTFFELGVSALGFRRTVAGLDVLAFDGNGHEGGRWAVTRAAASGDGWLRVTIRHDYRRQRWDLFLDGKAVCADLGFFAAPTVPSVIFGIFGGRGGETCVDDVRMGPISSSLADWENQGRSQSDDSAGHRSNPRSPEDRGSEQASKPAHPRRGVAPSAASAAAPIKNREQKLGVKLEVYSRLE